VGEFDELQTIGEMLINAVRLPKEFFDVLIVVEA
jgi:hypothetical protein